MSLNTENTNSAYLCGRLMAFYEKLQGEANPNLNKSVVDSSYRAFRSTPDKAKDRLVMLMNHHNKKLRRDNPGKLIYLTKTFDEIMSKMEQFPAKLSTEERGLFDFGYAHQRASFYTKKVVEETEKETATEVE